MYRGTVFGGKSINFAILRREMLSNVLNCGFNRREVVKPCRFRKFRKFKGEMSLILPRLKVLLKSIVLLARIPSSEILSLNRLFILSNGSYRNSNSLKSGSLEILSAFNSVCTRKVF